MPFYESAGFGAPPVGETLHYVGPPVSGPPAPPPPQTENFAEREAPPPRITSDADFLRYAYQFGLANLEAGKLAEKRAAADVVRAYGKRLRKVQERATREIRDIAARSHVSLPAAPDSDSQREIDRLRNSAGDAFDRRFMEYSIAEGQEFAQVAGSFPARNQTVRRFVAATTKDCGERLKLARRIVANRYGEGELATAEPQNPAPRATTAGH